ncbi:unnamed protein product [Moneuplotes crassus]|uniref:Uncharacterized protein n=1 Tax=Euplotes crassus TaxID=5936 RepID=A0AAD1XKV6_EUPCR|nr:unnamed protein product [Moneuplotes crassus]
MSFLFTEHFDSRFHHYRLNKVQGLERTKEDGHIRSNKHSSIDCKYMEGTQKSSKKCSQQGQVPRLSLILKNISIKKEGFQYKNPMEFVLQNMCDATSLYQFELPDRHQFDQKSLMVGNPEPDNKCQPPEMKKRDLKYADRSLQDSIPSIFTIEKKPQKNYMADSSKSLVKTERSSECITQFVPNSDPHQKKDVSQISTSSRQVLTDGKVATQLKVKKGCSLVGLNQGKVLMQIDKMQSSLPFKCKQAEGKVNMFLPQGPCEIFIMPLNQVNSDIPTSLGKPEISTEKERKILKNKAESAITSPSYTTNLKYGGADQFHQTAQNDEYLGVLDYLEQMFCLSPYHN